MDTTYSGRLLDLFRLSLFGDPWVALISFFLMALFLHYLLITKYPRTELWWKRSEYVWLAVGLLGVLSAALSWRRLEVRTKAAEIDGILEEQFYNVAKAIDLMATECRGDLNPSAPKRRHCETILGIDSVLEIESRQQGLITGERADHFMDFAVRGLEGSPEAQDYSRLVLTGKSYLSRRDSLRALMRRGEETRSQASLIFLAPLFISFALALRLTKTTADIRGYAASA